MPSGSVEDICAGWFWISLFLNRVSSTDKSQHDFSSWQFGFKDPNAKPFNEQRNHIQNRKPVVVLRTAFDYEELPSMLRQGVLNFVLHGEYLEEPPWGLADAGDHALGAIFATSLEGETAERLKDQAEIQKQITKAKEGLGDPPKGV